MESMREIEEGMRNGTIPVPPINSSETSEVQLQGTRLFLQERFQSLHKNDLRKRLNECFRTRHALDCIEDFVKRLRALWAEEERL